MLERKLDVMVEFWPGSTNCCDVWIDEGFKEQLAAMPGVASVRSDPSSKGCFMVSFDPRYDPIEVAAEIGDLVTGPLPSAFLGEV